MADSYVLLDEIGQLSPAEANPLIRRTARKAVEADPNLADAHMVLADSKEIEWDWAGAELEYRRAIELNPGLARAHHWDAVLLAKMNRPNEAIAEIQRAVDLDPLTDRLYGVEAFVYYYARQYDRAEQILGMFEEPAKHSVEDILHDLLGKIGLAKKNYPTAISEFLAMARAEPEEPDGWALLTYAYAQGGTRKEALASLAKLDQLGKKKYIAPYWMAIAWTGLGDHNKAVYFLSEAYRIKSSNLATIQADPLFDPLRSDPRFQELVHKIGFPSDSANRKASE
jgi:tetratricopeptide (TPR) repeat protein